MIREYQFYHGALLHEIVVEAGCEIRIVLRDFHGRPDAYLINGKVGVLIKHSKARLTPWVFTFSEDHLLELQKLREVAKVCFVVLVCDEDGFVAVRDADLIGILAADRSTSVSVRVDRAPRKMYRISSSGNALDRKVAKGVHEIIAALNDPKPRHFALLDDLIANSRGLLGLTSKG
jgi:hypothetical protein